MRIFYTKQAKEQLFDIKEFISNESKNIAISHLKLLKKKIELLSHFPYLGKENEIFKLNTIRDFIILGYKVIYKINQNSISILAIYKYIDFNESELEV